jgi:hypothetical protein
MSKFGFQEEIGISVNVHAFSLEYKKDVSINLNSLQEKWSPKILYSMLSRKQRIEFPVTNNNFSC